jgi:hypothetical protein
MSLSGKSYVSVVMEGETLDRKHLGRVPIRMSPEEAAEAGPASIPCEHGVTICSSRECQSWQWDYDVLWWRTEGGRNLFAKIYPDLEMPVTREAAIQFSIDHADRPRR